MIVLGIETSCDECSIALVADGSHILGQVIATQLEEHRPYNGVVPEIASRTHTEWISRVYEEALANAKTKATEIGAVAVTIRPGLVGSLVVGLSFAKALAFGLEVPLIGVNHILAHLYAPQLEQPIEYPYLGLLVSGGHTLICRVDGPLAIEVLGTTIDDACGEAFDKVAKHYGLGYPGGVAIDKLSARGDAYAYEFPDSSLHKGDHRYDISYSGLKTAVINHADNYLREGLSARDASQADLAASFQRAAIDSIVKRVKRVLKDTTMNRLVVGGGVAANSYLRTALNALPGVEAVFPSFSLCADNGAMIAGLGYHQLKAGEVDDLSLDVVARVPGFRKTYP
ncbi:MAG: tRNA (adenosine(37)-N6)-threonylcarbamoyltransferase complex transferase subunit TsaD [Spirochaetales bacterium]